jgi:hypothetical protein
MNDNKIKVYDSASSVPVYDPDELLDRAEQTEERVQICIGEQ